MPPKINSEAVVGSGTRAETTVVAEPLPMIVVFTPFGLAEISYELRPDDASPSLKPESIPKRSAW